MEEKLITRNTTANNMSEERRKITVFFSYSEMNLCQIKLNNGQQIRMR